MCSGHFCPFQMVFLAGQLGLCQYPLTATGIGPNFIHHESKRQSVLYCSNFPIQIHIPLRTICLFACLQALCLCFHILKGSVFFFWSCVVLNRLFLLWIETVIYFLGMAWTHYCLPHFKMYFGELKVFKCQKLRCQLSPRTAPILISNKSGHVALLCVLQKAHGRADDW